MPKHYLSINDVSKEEIIRLIDVAARLKSDRERGIDQSNILRGKTLGLIFEKPSLRTRISFEIGMKRLGGIISVMSANDIQIGKRESRQDISRILSLYLDLVMIRTFGHDIIEEMAEHSQIPIINGLTDLEHPCQTLADLLTIKEQFGRLEGIKVAYIGDGNNTVRSLMLAGTKLGMHVHVACPIGFEPGKEYESNFATVCHSVGEASQDADVIYTDVWFSMGHEKEAQKLQAKFSGFQVNKALLEEFAKPEAIVLHCLPAHRGEEITAEALKKHEDVILRQALNRLYTQQSVIMHLLNTAFDL
jgi:ornithine carbamoyltransferase